MRIVVALASVVLLSCSKKAAPIDGLNHHIKVMSFNVRYDNPDDGKHAWPNRKEACIALIDDLKPGVFGIQEGLEHQVTYLDSALTNYEYVGVAREDGETWGEYCALFYNKDLFEVEGSGTFWLSETPNYPSYGWDAACKRIVTWAALENDDSGHICYVFNTHFDHQGKEARKESAKLLVAAIDSIVGDTSTAVFITGDFNALKSSAILDPIKAAYFEARENALEKNNKSTFNAWGKLPGRKIDFIFYRRANAMSLESIHTDYGVKYISDHYPVLGTFEY